MLLKLYALGLKIIKSWVRQSSAFDKSIRTALSQYNPIHQVLKCILHEGKFWTTKKKEVTS